MLRSKSSPAIRTAVNNKEHVCIIHAQTLCGCLVIFRSDIYTLDDWSDPQGNTNVPPNPDLFPEYTSIS